MADPDSQQAAGWTPEFDGQRPPFRPGHEQSLVHGAHSERHVGPLAAQIAAELLADPDTPAHLHESLFASSLIAWARAEAICQLLWRYLEGQDDIAAAMTEVTTGIETEEATNRKTTRKTAGKRVASVLDTLRRYETLAGNLRGRLGLDPASAARIGRDLAQRRHYDGATPLDQAVSKTITAMAQHQALPAGTDGDQDDGDSNSPA